MHTLSSAERESKSKSPQVKSPQVKSTPVETLTNGTEKIHENGTGEKAADTTTTPEPDSYEARREARRKAREERQKAAAAKSVAYV